MKHFGNTTNMLRNLEKMHVTEFKELKEKENTIKDKNSLKRKTITAFQITLNLYYKGNQ